MPTGVYPRKITKTPHECEQCSVVFYRFASRRGRYCTKGCWYESKKGRKTPDEVRKKMSASHKKGVEHRMWKGNGVSYSGLHKWIYRQLGKASKCTYCPGTTAKRFEWANVSGMYKRDLDDWFELCVLCHRRRDNSIRKQQKQYLS